MTSKKNTLLGTVLEILEDMKAVNVVSLDVRHITDIADDMVICSGTSSRHTQSIADRLLTHCKEKGFSALGTEGQDTGEWILVDLGDVIVHILLPETREFYDLEKLWSAAERRREEQ